MQSHDEFKLTLGWFTRRRFLGLVGAGELGTLALRIGSLLGLEAAPMATDRGVL